MVRPARATAAILVLVVGVVGIAAVVVFVASSPEPSPPAKGTTRPATATAPATQAVVQRPPRTYGELLKSVHPQLASTQPLGISLDLTDAAHVVLRDPIFVCSRSDLWITRPDADRAEQVLAKAVDEQSHLTRDLVLFVHWSPDERGKWQPRLVCPREGGDAGAAADFVSPTSRTPIPGKHAYLWHRAFSWGDRIVVPTESGISLLAPGEQMSEIHHEFAPAGASNLPPAEPQVTFDARGIIAWMPWDAGQRGSAGAVRFADGKFSPLAAAEGWPEKLIHVVPLLDGSVLQVVVGDNGRIQPKLAVLDAPQLDEPKVTALVDQLSDADPDNRQKAYNELTRYGPGVWPLLEKLLEDQPPEARIRLQQLLANKIQPTLGGITLVDGELTTAFARLHDGGVVFFAPAGVSFPRENGPPQLVKPAWISVRPGKAIELLPDQLMKDAAPPKQQVYAYTDEWVLSDDEKGPQRLLFNHMTPLLREDEKLFGRLYAIDRRGRWLFRKSGAQPGSDGRETLVLDPTFADPTPRLPIWLIELRNGTVGWDEKDWPVTKSGGAWALRERGWQVMDEAKEKMITELPAAARDDSNRPLLVDAEGNRYFDGGDILHVISKSSAHTVWPLPISARGHSGGTLLRAADGRLFLFNQTGRILRIKPTPDGDEPFKLEGSFTHRVPTSDRISRIWLDAANRICITYDGNRLAILFPEGVIPPHIATMIPSSGLR